MQYQLVGNTTHMQLTKADRFSNFNESRNAVSTIDCCLGTDTLARSVAASVEGKATLVCRGAFYTSIDGRVEGTTIYAY